MAGHGGDGFMKFQDQEELTSSALADALATMHTQVGALLQITNPAKILALTCHTRRVLRSQADRCQCAFHKESGPSVVEAEAWMHAPMQEGMRYGWPPARDMRSVKPSGLIYTPKEVIVVQGRHRELLMVVETCQAESLHQKLRSPNVLAIAASKVGARSVLDRQGLGLQSLYITPSYGPLMQVHMQFCRTSSRFVL